jgi:hypothetical protein
MSTLPNNRPLMRSSHNPYIAYCTQTCRPLNALPHEGPKYIALTKVSQLAPPMQSTCNAHSTCHIQMHEPMSASPHEGHASTAPTRERRPIPIAMVPGNKIRPFDEMLKQWQQEREDESNAQIAKILEGLHNLGRRMFGHCVVQPKGQTMLDPPLLAPWQAKHPMPMLNMHPIKGL